MRWPLMIRISNFWSHVIHFTHVKKLMCKIFGHKRGIHGSVWEGPYGPYQVIYCERCGEEIDSIGA